MIAIDKIALDGNAEIDFVTSKIIGGNRLINSFTLTPTGADIDVTPISVTRLKGKPGKDYFANNTLNSKTLDNVDLPSDWFWVGMTTAQANEIGNTAIATAIKDANKYLATKGIKSFGKKKANSTALPGLNETVSVDTDMIELIQAQQAFTPTLDLLI